jgi:hypothetical protein
VQIEPELGCYRVDLPKKDWHANADFDHLERVRLELRNPDARPRTVRLLLAKDYAFEGITGLSPMLRDADGEPTGIPIQLSKNWHRKQGEHLLYEGPWFHGLTMLRLPPRSRLQCEATIAFDRWGGVPAASHAQLCLVGWGTDQLWDQAAVGSWGESICYEPDVTQRRGMIDDVRPLMVWAMNQDHGKWNWTQNVGGGDFLVLHDTDGQRQYLARMKTAYVAQCPCLTEVTYAGTTPDGAIDAQITVSTPRTDDYVRAFHRFRYDVRKAVGFSRLAFYQLGADHYNDAPVREMARGNAAGMIDAWQPPAELPKTAQYVRTGLSCDGRLPWASLHHALRRDEKGGALANRGLIVRSWKARLGGREVAAPSMASFRTIGERGNVNVELTPPPNLHELQPGDFVEAEVELVVMPIAADDYYGPNENLRAALKQDGDTWKMIRREAVGNDLVVEVVRGRAIHAYPVHVEADASGRAEFSVTGGIGYVPVIVNGLKRPGGWVLKQTIDGGEKPAATTVYGKECCQADYDAAAGTWRLIYNVSLDSPGDVRRPARFVLE